MKATLWGAIMLLSIHLNAQIMATPDAIVTKLFVAADEKDWENVKEVFDVKVLLDYSSMTGNPASELTPDEIITAWKGILPGFEATHHQLGNFSTTIEGNKAKVFCYGTATHFLKDEKGSVWTVVGTYDFELVQDASQHWKISAMKFNFKYQDGNTGLPEKAMGRIKK